MWDLTQIRLVGQTNGSVSPWKRAGSSSGKPRGENLYLFLSSKLTSSLQHTKTPVTAQTPTYITPSQLVTATIWCEAWHKGSEATRWGITNHKGCARCEMHETAFQPLSGYIPPPTHSLWRFNQTEWNSTHSPCQVSPPRLIRVEQTLTEHKSVLHNQLERPPVSSFHL